MLSCFPFRSCQSDAQSVDKRHCNLHSVPKEVFKSSETLEECILDSNQITELPKKLFLLPRLRRLMLSDNLLTRVPDGIGSLVKLQELDISRNDITEISERIKLCVALVSVDLCSNPIKTLPKGLFLLKNLANLNMNDIGLTELPAGIGNLVNLRRLELRDNVLEQLPSSLGNLRRLEMLDLGSNEFERLPEAVCSLSALQELFVDSNHLQEFPVNFAKNLPKLQQLDASDNQLQQLPENLGSLSSLTDLSLKSNSIQKLPKSIGQLLKLSILRLEQNNIDSLPNEIGQCVELQELHLAENKLRTLPASIGSWGKLINLNTDRNMLAALPVQLCSLRKLHILSLRDNHISSLPSDMGSLKALKVLDLVGNHLKALPASLASCRLTALWLSDQQTQPLVSLQTAGSKTSGSELTCYLLPQARAPDHDCESVNNDNSAASVSLAAAALSDGSTSASASPPPHQGVSQHQLDSQISAASAASASGAGAVAKQRGAVKYAKRLVDGPVIPHAPGGHPKELSFSPRRISPAPSDPEIGGGAPAAPGRLARESSVPIGISHSARVPHAASASPWQQQQQQQRTVPVIRFNSLEKERGGTVGQEDAAAGELASTGSGGSGAAFRHVGFAGELADNESKSSGWKRRDTPHYNKNAKITKCQDSEFAAQLLQKYGAGGRRAVSESSGGGASARSPSEAGDGYEFDAASLSAVAKQQLTVVLERQAGAQLGLSIAGGVGSQPWLPEDNGIFLSKVIDGFPAYSAGLRPGDRLLSVCGVSLVTASHAEAVKAIQSAGQRLELQVERHLTVPKARDGDVREENNGEPAEAAEKDKEDEDKDRRSEAEAEEDESPRPLPSRGSLERLHDIGKFGGKKIKRFQPDNDNGPDTEADGDAAESLWLCQQPQPAREQTAPVAIESPDKQAAADQPEESLADQDSIPLGPDEVCIELQPDSSGRLGLSICGSCDRPAHPFGVGLYVSRLTPGLPAASSGLKVGDRLLSANGRSLARAAHREAIAAMRATPDGSGGVLRLRVRHEPPPAGYRCLRIPLPAPAAAAKPASAAAVAAVARPRLGIAVCGGAGSPPANPDDPTDEGVFVAKVSPGGLFHSDGQLKTGMRLLDANGRNLIGVSREEAVSILRSLIAHPAVNAAPDIQLTVCDGCPSDRLLLGDADDARPLSGISGGGALRRESSTSIDPGEEIEHLKELRLLGQQRQSIISSEEPSS
ncbi:hypothetical protein BOX15_Mlig002152g1 [Macrostomum lignano]|uniref:PDZ domain-containing protein n=1 Tax=Macrostomum lignano TaxID=282301 RepID=A0A267F4A8_9PLAT|nr:hypothetical protein BOX15_Mlig002152g1 [Macrostomum lignano]